MQYKLWGERPPYAPDRGGYTDSASLTTSTLLESNLLKINLPKKSQLKLTNDGTNHTERITHDLTNIDQNKINRDTLLKSHKILPQGLLLRSHLFYRIRRGYFCLTTPNYYSFINFS